MAYPFLKRLGIEKVNPGGFNGRWLGGGSGLEVISPIDGSQIATVTQCTARDYERISREAQQAFEYWREIPAPKRGEVVRQLGHELREHKEDLGRLVTLEMGKILPEGVGEVQEMIDICDFAVGLSRQLYGLTMPSERPRHFMMEQWHPLGVVGIISAFNFPVAVWSWNAALAAVCGDAMIWKPASKTPLTAIAVTKIAERVLKRNGVPPALMSLVVGRGGDIGDVMLDDDRLKLVSLTGSTRVGHHAAARVAARFGRTILELGGNNAIIVTPSANMDLAIRAILFGAVGTAGQRCTTTRRIIAHQSVKSKLVAALAKAYKQVPIGNPLKAGTLMGPLVDTDAVDAMMGAIERVKGESGKVVCGGKKLDGKSYPGGCYVTPCIMETPRQLPMVCEETFAPILYVMKYRTLDEAIALHNGVPQGLSSAIFTDDVREAQRFLSATGSDCGIANVNIGTSGAEIGGAFGGEKETGGGRESGSDSWKAYMRRQTNTVNWGGDMPLAQGIEFG
jgi:aldehyde dehydrogenase (NAD+)